MIKIQGIHHILSDDEYNKLTNPDITYSILTKTAANKAVVNLLKYFNHKCHHDIDLNNSLDYSEENSYFYCSECPIITVLGSPGKVICQRSKTWSK